MDPLDLLGDRPDYDPGADASLAARADAEATTPADLAYDALLAHDAPSSTRTKAA